MRHRIVVAGCAFQQVYMRCKYKERVLCRKVVLRGGEINIDSENEAVLHVETGMVQVKFIRGGQPQQIIAVDTRIAPLGRHIEENNFFKNEVVVAVISTVEAAGNNEGIPFEGVHPEAVPHAV